MTVQGEGPSCGQRASFIRFGGCNLKCNWCDTPYTWDASRYKLRDELARTDIDGLVAEVLGHGTGLVVLTGGEPLLQQQQPGWQALVLELATRGIRLEVETNGTIAPSTFALTYIDQFNVSPKLANSGDPLERRIRPEALRELVLSRRAWFKFVCADESDVREVAALAIERKIPRDRIWIMPQGTSEHDVLQGLRTLTPHALEHGFHITPRLHVLIWGEERGR